MKNRGALPGVSTGMSLWCQTKVEMSLFVPIWCCWWFCGSLAWEGTQPCAAAERAELEAQSLPTMAAAPFNESSYLVAEVRFHLGLVQGPNRF